MRVGGQHHAPAALTPGKRPGTHCIGSWVGPRAGLDGCGKSRSPPGIRSPDRPARSESLYRLSYPGPRTARILYETNKPLYKKEEEPNPVIAVAPAPISYTGSVDMDPKTGYSHGSYSVIIAQCRYRTIILKCKVRSQHEMIMALAKSAPTSFYHDVRSGHGQTQFNY
jgi:hypothetical protein